MTDLRELIARVAKHATGYVAVSHYESEVIADAIIAALDAAGLVVVPRAPTERMIDVGCDYVEFINTASDAYRAMIAASPYMKGEKE